MADQISLWGGTPCQSFSIAGLRKGMDDERGNLALEYLRLAQRIRTQWLVWENVPGVLSSNEGRDFGSFIGGLEKLGYGFAYRILDAQYIGVAQRRRRVFVVGYLGDWRPPAAVLFESDSLSWNSPPSREPGEVIAGTVTAGIGRRRGGGINPELLTHKNTVGSITCQPYGDRGDENGKLICIAHGQGGAETRSDNGTPTLSCNHESPIVAIHPHCIGRKPESGSQGKEYLEDGSSYCLDSRGTPQAIAIRTANTNANGHGISENRAHTLDGANGKQWQYPRTYGGK